MNVAFEFIAPDGTIWTEQDLSAAGDKLPDVLTDLMPHYGRLVIEDPAQDDETSISDDLATMMIELCVRSAGYIAAGRDVTYTLAAHSEEVSFAAHDGRVAIEGDATDELWCDAKALAKAMLDAGARFIALKTQQNGAEATLQMTQYLERARAT